MGIQSIRQVIADAAAADAGSLRQYFESRMGALAARLELPAEDPVGALVAFTRKYIEYVPDFLELIRLRARALGVEQQAAPYLDLAEDFFLAPPVDLKGESGLHALLDEAFLAQRLIEEVNDRLSGSRGQRLVDTDMTRANIIAHHLVGEPLATRLEMLVDQSLGLLAHHNRLFSRAGVEAGDSGGIGSLPCMSREVAVDLRL
jgi:hypothetical protein